MLFSLVTTFSILTVAFAAPPPPAASGPTPLAPAPGTVFNEGTNCSVSWSVDPTGTWNTMYLQLMTGDNDDMVFLSLVGTVDGTTQTTYSYPCLSVDLHAPVYFYQFTSPASDNKFWTGRFTIAGPNGDTVPAPNATQPDGDAKPWGTGHLSDPTQATPLPSGGPPPGGPTSPLSSSTPASTSMMSNSSSPSAMPTTTGLPTSSMSAVPLTLPSSSTGSLASASGSAPAAVASSRASSFSIPHMPLIASFMLAIVSYL